MRILVRCDGGPGIGVGHVVRSLALAEEAIARGHEVALLGRLEGDLLAGLARTVGSGLRLLDDSGPGTDDGAGLAAAAVGYDVLHVDHYEVSARPDELFEAAGGAGTVPLVSVMADGEFGARPCDVLIDPTIGAQWKPAQAPARWHLRGARYVPLRSDVLARRATEPKPSEGAAARVLVVMGGVDPRACAPAVVDALAATRLDLAVTVVATPKTRPDLERRAREEWLPGRLVVTPPLEDLPAAMAGADIVVTAAGTSVWELCAMARPMAVVAVVDNQVPGYLALLGAGAALGLGGPDDLTDRVKTAQRLVPLLEEPARRAAVAAAAGRLVDGLGAWRVVRAWEECHRAAPDLHQPSPAVVEVRAATLADADVLLRWRNDPATRASSRSHEVVSHDAHLGWLEASLTDPARRLLVGEDSGDPVGTVRWDDEGEGRWQVSITVAPEMRGRGVAGPLLRAAEDWLTTELRGPVAPAPNQSRPHRIGNRRAGGELAAYLAVVHESNSPSRRLFLRGGYLPDLPADDLGFERYVKWVRPGPT